MIAPGGDVLGVGRVLVEDHHVGAGRGRDVVVRRRAEVDDLGDDAPHHAAVAAGRLGRRQVDLLGTDGELNGLARLRSVHRHDDALAGPDHDDRPAVVHPVVPDSRFGYR